MNKKELEEWYLEKIKRKIIKGCDCGVCENYETTEKEVINDVLSVLNNKIINIKLKQKYLKEKIKELEE